MRKNKAILDEAARSVRRTFVGSVAGTVAMLGVVGAAGAYGMPEKLTTQALTVALAKFNLKIPHEQAAASVVAAVVSRPVVLVQNAPDAMNAMARASMPVSPVSDVVPENPVVRTVPQVETPAAPVVTLPVTSPAPIVPPREVAVAVAPPVANAKPSPVATIEVATPVAELAPISNPFVPAEPAPIAPAKLAPVVPVEPAPAPTVTASLTPQSLPEAAQERPLISAPLVFEAPKPSDVQVLTELP
jgi:hypothetical protein